MRILYNIKRRRSTPRLCFTRHHFAIAPQNWTKMQYRRAALHRWAHLHRSHAQLDPSTRYRYVAKRKYTLPLLDLGPQNGSPLCRCRIALHASLPNRYRTVPDRMVQSHSSTWPGLTITGLNTQHFTLTGYHRAKPHHNRTQ